MVSNFSKDKIIKTIVLIMIFLMIFSFFTFVRPFVPFDGDDWLNLENFRSSLLPMWGAFNPSKVLPEVLQPMVGIVSGILTLLTHNFVDSIIIVCSILISILFILVVNELWKFLSLQFNMKSYGLSVVLFLYVIFQFIILKTNPANNGFLLLPIDFTCLFHYVIPGLLCQYLTLTLLNNGPLIKIYKVSIKKFSIILILLYFSVFSNVLINVMIPLIMAYMLITYRKEIGKWGILEISIIGIWIISLIFEMSGGRSQSFSGVSLKRNITIIIEKLSALRFNHSFLLFITLILISIGVFFLIRRIKVNHWNIYLFLIFSGIASLAYQILVCARSNPDYILRPDVLSVPLFYFMITLSMIIAFVSGFKPMKIAIFFALILLSIDVFNTNDLFSSSVTAGGSTPMQAKALANSMIRKIINSDKDGKKSTEIYVPKRNGNDNWPNSVNIGDNISSLLYKTGLIGNRISVKTVPLKSLNDKYLTR